VTLARALYEKILRHGESVYPEEACGFLIADASGAVVDAVAVTNAAAKMRDESGGEFTRSARDGYVMDPKEQLAVERAADAAGQTVLGVYHSHPDVGAYFSSEDRKRALFLDAPLYPKWIVADVKKGKGEGAKLFVWSDATKDFVEEPLSIG
jgi:adenylyltransferase/sulfurtransferase